MFSELKRQHLRREHFNFVDKTFHSLYVNQHKAIIFYLFAYPLVFCLFPILSNLIFLFVLNHARTTAIRMNSQRGPFLIAEAGKDHRTESWVRIDGPPDRGGRGDFFIGNAQITGEEIWARANVFSRHMLVFGQTGSGKTEMLKGPIFQAIAKGSGVIFADGKSDPKTWFDVYSIAKRCGRENDVRVINFISGEGYEKVSNLSKEEAKILSKIQSNTYNPLSNGTSDMLSELMISLMRPEGNNSDGMFRGRAESLIRTVIRALCLYRDRGVINLSASVLREHMTLEKISDIEEEIKKEELTGQALLAYQGFVGYLNELPNFREAQKIPKDNPQRQQYMEQADKQHGFLTMQFTELFGLMEGTYKHIFDVENGDIDFMDVIYNRRILLIMLPALEKSPSSLSTLGRIAVAGIKSALSAALSGQLTGEKSTIVDRRPTNTKIPLLAIMDEYGSYAVDGFGDVVAQARSLGVGVIFAGQDFPSFKRGSEIEASRIKSNTGLKLFLKTEEDETAEMAIRRGSKGMFLYGGDKHRNQNGEIVDTGSSTWREEDRITYDDLTGLAEGWGFLMYEDRCIPINTSYVDIKPEKSAKYNQMFPLGGRNLIKKLRENTTQQNSSGRLNKPRKSEADEMLLKDQKLLDLISSSKNNSQNHDEIIDDDY